MINTIANRVNSTLIEQVVKANFEDNDCFKLCHTLEIDGLAKDINFCHFYYLLIN